MKNSHIHRDALSLAFDKQAGYSLIPGVGEAFTLTRWGGDGFRRVQISPEA